MGFNFPNSPTPGQVYSPVGGYSYVWLDGVWRIVADPQGIGTAETRNRIINGAMQISQELAKEGGYAVPGLTPYIADQWVMNATTGATAAIGICNASTTVPGVNWRLNLYSGATPDTSIAAGDVARIYQPVEGIRIADFGWGTAAAQQVVLRFTARSTMAGTFCVAIINGAGNRSYIKNCVLAVANTDQEFTLVIPGDVTGTWPTTAVVAAYVQFTIMAGTSIHGVEGWNAGASATSAISNFFGTAATSFYISKVGLYLDPNNTGVAPPWVMPDEAEELRACQRYFTRLTSLVQQGHASTASMGQYHVFALPVTMRIGPAAAFSGIGYTNASGITGTCWPMTFRASVIGTAIGMTLTTYNADLSARM